MASPLDDFRRSLGLPGGRSGFSQWEQPTDSRRDRDRRLSDLEREAERQQKRREELDRLLSQAGLREGKDQQSLELTRDKYAKRMAVAKALGIESDGQSAGGLLQAALGTLDAPKSVVVGGLSGLLGLEKDGDRPDGFGERLKSAGQRALRGAQQNWQLDLLIPDSIAGGQQESFGSGDFESFLKYDDDDRWYERGGKAAGAFTTDVLLDPLTYVTFGGAAVGRKGAAEFTEQATRKIAKETLDSAGDDAVREAARHIPEEQMADALSSITGHRMEDLLDAGSDVMLDLAERHGVLRSFADEGFSYGAASAVRDEGSKGLRKYLGDEVFDQLPDELRGGVRLRVPFKKDEAGLPFAKSVPGTGGGRILESVGLGGAHDVLNQARRATRASSVGRLANTGRHGRLYQQMVRDAASGVGRASALTWARYEAIRQVDRAVREYTERLDRQVADALVSATVRVSAQHADDVTDESLARRHMQDYFLHRERMLERDPSTLAGEELAGLEAANILYQSLIDPLGAEVKVMMDRLGKDMGWLDNYVPRILAEEERARRLAVYKPGRTRPSDNAASRDAYVAEWGLNADGNLTVTRWMSPDEVQHLEGRLVFETDPAMAAAEYAQKMRSVLRTEFLQESLRRTGLLIHTGTEGIDPAVNATKVGRAAGTAEVQVSRAIEALRGGDRDEAKKALKALGFDPDLRPERGADKRWWNPAKRKAGEWVSEDGVRIYKNAKGKWVLDMEDPAGPLGTVESPRMDPVGELADARTGWRQRQGRDVSRDLPPDDGRVRRPQSKDDPWSRLASEQRGEPEAKMLEVQAVQKGLYGFLAEHVGDLSHRVSEWPTRGTAGFEFMREKVRRALTALRHPYGYEREVLEQIRSNGEDVAVVRAAGQAYADAHRALLPLAETDAQRISIEAAIAHGEWRFDDEIALLEQLEPHLNDVDDWLDFTGAREWEGVRHYRMPDPEPELATYDTIEQVAEAGTIDDLYRLADQFNDDELASAAEDAMSNARDLWEAGDLQPPVPFAVGDKVRIIGDEAGVVMDIAGGQVNVRRYLDPSDLRSGLERSWDDPDQNWFDLGWVEAKRNGRKWEEVSYNPDEDAIIEEEAKRQVLSIMDEKGRRNYQPPKPFEPPPPPPNRAARGPVVDGVDLHRVEVDREQAQAIREAYLAAPVYDNGPEVKRSYDAMWQETEEQYRYLTEELGITVEVTPHDPYPTVDDMVRDVRENKRLRVLSTESTGGHPYFPNEVNDKFRAVHDAFGHAATGRAFDRHGEEAAWWAHRSMYSDVAARAMTSETRGQNAALTQGARWGGFEEQKFALLPEWVSDTPPRMAHGPAEDGIPVAGVHAGEYTREAKAVLDSEMGYPPQGGHSSIRPGESTWVAGSDADGNPAMVEWVREGAWPARTSGETQPARYVYRAVSEDDWARIRQQGHIDTDGRMNLVDDEGLVADLGDPSFYLPREGAGRILRIRYDAADGWKVDPRDGYAKTQQQVPLDRVDLVSPRLVGKVDGTRHSRHIEPTGDVEDFGPGRPVAEQVEFGTLTEAREFADEFLAEPRAAEAFARDRGEALTNLMADERTLTHAMAAENLPTDKAELDLYLASLVETVGRYSDGVTASDLYNHPQVRDQLARWAQREGLKLVQTDEGLRTQWAQRMADAGAFAAPAIRDHLVRQWRTSVGRNPDLTRFADNVYAPLFTAWKAYATIGRGPSFNMRNLIGAAWNAHLLDVQVRHFKDSALTMLAARKVVQAIEEAQGFPPTQKAARRALADGLEAELAGTVGKKRARQLADDYAAFVDHGLADVRTGRLEEVAATAGLSEVVRPFHGDRTTLFPSLADDELATWQRALNKTVDNPWMRFNSNLTQNVEGYVRFASFLKGADRWGRDGDFTGAALTVKATQFDYDDLSDFERTILKNIVPFYVWSRNNVPLQFRSLMQNPGKVNRLLRANEAAQDVFGADHEDDEAGHAMPDWVRERHGWVSKFKTPLGGQPITLGIESPLMDLNKWTGAPDSLNPVTGFGVIEWSEAVNALNPFVKVGVESFTGTSTFTGGKLQDEKMLGVEVDGRVANAARQLNPLYGTGERLTGLSDRSRERLFTSWLSTAAAVPASTLTPRQERSELMARLDRLEEQIEDVDNGEAISRLAGQLLEAGYDPEDIARILAVRGVVPS